jgi:hypothetical protein
MSYVLSFIGIYGNKLQYGNCPFTMGLTSFKL